MTGWLAIESVKAWPICAITVASVTIVPLSFSIILLPLLQFKLVLRNGFTLAVTRPLTLFLKIIDYICFDWFDYLVSTGHAFISSSGIPLIFKMISPSHVPLEDGFTQLPVHIQGSWFSRKYLCSLGHASRDRGQEILLSPHDIVNIIKISHSLKVPDQGLMRSCFDWNFS